MQDSTIDLSLRFWKGQRRGRELPARRDLDVTAVPALLQHLILVEAFGDGADFRFALVGEHVSTDCGTRSARRHLSKLAADDPILAASGDNFRDCMDARSPMAFLDEFRSAASLPSRTFGAVDPLSPGGEAVDALLCCSIYQVRGADE